MVAAKAEVEEGFEPGGRGETGWQNQRRMDHPLLSAWSQPPSQADKLLHPHHRYSGTKSSPIPDARVSLRVLYSPLKDSLLRSFDASLDGASCHGLQPDRDVKQSSPYFI